MPLTVTATFTSNGKTYKPGEIVGVTNEQVFIDLYPDTCEGRRVGDLEWIYPVCRSIIQR